jgi:hypothetical protein
MSSAFAFVSGCGFPQAKTAIDIAMSNKREP